VLVYNVETDEIVDLKWPMGRVDGYNVQVKLKDSKLDEITNHVRDFGSYEHGFMDDDQTSVKTSSSHTSSSVFRGFLRRSSKKYKKKIKNAEMGSSIHGVTEESASTAQKGAAMAGSSSPLRNEPELENAKPLTPRTSKTTGCSAAESPLSLISSDLKLVETSRNRKPIYMTQSLGTNES